MKITVMCAVPFRRMDYAPVCVDRRGGQIYHDALPCFYVKSPSHFPVDVAVSFLLEYEPEDVEVSHLAYVVGTARMFGEIIGTTRNDFFLNPFAPFPCNSNTGRFATYENVPLFIECSGSDIGLIELSWALRVDTYAEPVAVSQNVYVRSWTHPNPEAAISTEEYDARQMREIARIKKEKRRNTPGRWNKIVDCLSPSNFWRPYTRARREKPI